MQLSPLEAYDGSGVSMKETTDVIELCAYDLFWI